MLGSRYNEAVAMGRSDHKVSEKMKKKNYTLTFQVMLEELLLRIK
jgi:hypothetical protein